MTEQQFEPHRPGVKGLTDESENPFDPRNPDYYQPADVKPGQRKLGTDEFQELHQEVFDMLGEYFNGKLGESGIGTGPDDRDIAQAYPTRNLTRLEDL